MWIVFSTWVRDCLHEGEKLASWVCSLRGENEEKFRGGESSSGDSLLFSATDPPLCLDLNGEKYG